jgi:putative DNA primase/helicase
VGASTADQGLWLRLSKQTRASDLLTRYPTRVEALMSLAEVARDWVRNGVSVAPIKPDQTKRPAIRWGEYQIKIPAMPVVDEWWSNGSSYGLAVICGSVSGNLEMLELEGRACSGDQLTEITNCMDEAGVGHVWDLLVGPEGYSEMSPSGGIHLLYRISDNKVPGNTKIARGDDGLVLCETRGEGGYVIVAPTQGLCHPSGEAWVMLQGQSGSVPEITWYERCKVHEALASALDSPLHRASTPPDSVSLAPAVLPADPRSGLSTAGLSPGDHYEQVTDWAEILEPHGWRLESTTGRERHWTRPDKDPRLGSSATTGFKQDRDRLFVFSSSTIFQVETPYTKFAAYALLNHGGDYHAAAVELKRNSYGVSAPSTSLEPWDPGAEDIHEQRFDRYDRSDSGNADQLYLRIQASFRYLKEEREYICWDGVKWARDQRYRLELEYTTMALELAQQAARSGEESWEKWWIRSRNQARIEAAIKGLRRMPGFTITADEMNRDRRVLNLKNGIMDLTTGQLMPHDPDRMMTRTMGAAYDPEATCPRFESFMAKVLPDNAMRAYVQRALGYSMLGDADQRSLFLVCGPSGTGKSTLMATMEMVFGDYGVAAPTGTLRAGFKEQSGPSVDLHMLRGKRFVSTSETNEHTAYNEDLIKRLTGRDQIQSRSLYQEHQAWAPVCSIWLATNHPPKFSSDDDAIWRRAKIIPFTTVLLGDGEVPDYAHNVLADECDGIFNWLMAGLREYLIRGLGEPDEVKATAHEVRLQSDSTARYIEDQLTDGILIQADGERIRTSELYQMYSEWAKRLGERPVGSRRFIHRVQATQSLDLVRINGYQFWRGIGRSGRASLLGTFQVD